MGLLFVAARQLVLHAGDQVGVCGAADRPLDDLQPPGRVQVDLHRKSDNVSGNTQISARTHRIIPQNKTSHFAPQLLDGL